MPIYLIPLFEEFIKLRISEGFKPGTIVALNTTVVRLRRYETATSHKLRLDSYTSDVHRSVLNNLQEQDLEPVSISNVCKHLITFFRYCRESLGLQLHANHAKIVKETFESDLIYLTDADLQKPEATALPQHLDRVRDAFLFQCYTGLRYSDLWRLEHRHIEQRGGYQVISIIPQKSVSRKTGIIKRIEIPLLDGALRILERYAGNYRILPILSNQKMNDSLKEVTQLVGLTDFVESVEYIQGVPQIVAVEKWKRVSSHVARHTYATLSLMKGVPLEVVSKALGHTTTKPTLIYAKIVDEWKNQTILNAWKDKPAP